MSIKGRWADIRVWFLNTVYKTKSWIGHFTRDLTHDLKIDENGDLRLFVFVVVYLLFSLVGAYNFAHLTAFLYIIWLLEKRHGN